MKANPVAYTLLDAHKAMGNAVCSLEQSARKCKAQSVCRAKVFVAIAQAKETMASVEELAHLAATGEWK